MRLAVFHDFLDKIGGGEKLALTVARRLDGDVYTTNRRPIVVERMSSADARIHDLGGVLPLAPLKQMHASWRFHRCRVPGYDVYLFSGNWAHYASRRHGPSVYYCHTPVRAFYDQREAMLGRLPAWQRPLYRGWTRIHSRFDVDSIRRTDRVLANSENVRRRVERYYGRDATVVHPPVVTRGLRFREVGDFWLSINRLYPEKRIDLQLDIFRQLPEERLVVVGGWAEGDHSGPYVRSLNPPSNVEFVGELGEEQLADLYGRCRGLIATAVDEDFGLTPVEAMAAGKAVLATREGGYLESVIEGETGWLLPPDVKVFAEKIRTLDDDTLAGVRSACESRAKLFSEDLFVDKMRSILEDAAAS